MYSPLEPYDAGMLRVGQGHQIHWEVSGNPEGIDALYLHGGPGSTLRPGYRRTFDPERYRIIGIQQRGAGLSTPHVTDPRHRLSDNTTQHLLDDLDAVRSHLGVERWLVSGVSWGSTLALHHALRDPSRVLGIILVAVTTTSPDEVAWISEGVGRLYPEAWDELTRFVQQNSSWRHGEGPLIDAVGDLLCSDEVHLRGETAAHWMAWEDSHIQIGLPLDQLRRRDYEGLPSREQLAMATLVAHYWRNHGFGPVEGLTEHLGALRGLPLCMVHGRRDVSGPVSIPWGIKAQLPDAQLHVVEGEGHGGAMMMELWRAATDSFARHHDFSATVGLL